MTDPSQPAPAPAALSLDAVERRFVQGERTLEVLRGVALRVDPGEVVALVGPSGAGKSTLLQIAGLLEKPDAGTVAIAGQQAGGLGDKARTLIRRTSIGFVYQFHHLLPEFSARENVILPQMIAAVARTTAGARADDLLARVGLTERASHRPARLSGGEQQRVAIARALANRPALLLADEPTGNLDHVTSDTVFALLVEIARESALGALIATHNLELAARMDRRLELIDGRIEER